MSTTTLLDTPRREPDTDDQFRSEPSEPDRHRRHVRSPVDVLRMIVGGVLIAAGIGVANLLDSAFLGLSADGGTAMEGFPGWVVDVPATALAAAITVTAAALVAWTLSTGRFRRLFLFTTAAAIAAMASIAVGHAIYSIIDDAVREAFRVDSAGFRFTRGDNIVHPGDPLLAGFVAIIGIATSYARHSTTRRMALLAAAYAAVSLVSTGVPAVGTVADVGVGVLTASLVLLIAGRHDLTPDHAEIEVALGSIGLEVHHLERLAVDARASAPWTATLSDGRRVFVKALGSDERSADLMFRAYRWARLRKTGDHRPFVSLQRSVEHEALVSLQAAALGVRTPRILGVATAGIDGMVLIYEAIEGSSADTLDDLEDHTLEGIWSMVGQLHQNRIAHRDLRLANIFIDVDGQPWLIDFGFSELAASDQLIGTDAAELLTSTAAVVGPRRAVAAAHRSTGHRELERTMRWLQPLALSSATRQSIGGTKGIAPIRELLINECGISEEPPHKLERIDRTTLFIFATLGLSAWFLIPQLADLDQVWEQVQSGSPGWGVAAIAFSLLTYVAATASLLGAIPVRLKFAPALAAQLASSFANRVTPAKVGGVATNVRYFQRRGVPTAVVGTAIGLNAIAGLIMHVTLIVLFFLLSSADGGVELPLPSPSTVGLAFAILATAIAVALALPQTRRLVGEHVIPQLRTGLTSLVTIAHSPARLLALFGGSAAITLAYTLAMIASLQAFGSDASLPLVALLFLAGSAVATAAPTPGGLGATEAALIAALSTIEQADIVVPAVFLYRLVTFWLPILPGWIALTALRRANRL